MNPSATEYYEAYLEGRVYQESGYLKVILPRSNRVIASLPFANTDELYNLLFDLEGTNVVVVIQHREWTECYTAIYNDKIEEVMEDHGLLNCQQHVNTAFARIRSAMKRYAELTVIEHLNKSK